MTIWPVEAEFLAGAENDDCSVALDHYDLETSEDAISDARFQKHKLAGAGPFLLGWAPSDTRGVADQLVLEEDFSQAATQQQIDNLFRFWKDDIVANPERWRHGFSLEPIREAIANFADQYGQDILSAIKLVSVKGD